MTLPLPVTIIGGYLGAGKTTLVNHLLRHAGGRRIGVLVNDFGQLPIDADLIRARHGEVLELTGGCMCCSIGGDEGAAYDTVLARADRLDHLVIETSGVALPGGIALTLGLYAGFRLDGVVVLADAETVQARAGDPYVGDAVMAQLSAADLVILNRTDLAGPDGTARARAFLAGVVPRVPILSAERACVPSDVLLGLRDGEVPRPGSRFASDHASAYATLALAVDHAVDPVRLAAMLANAELGLLRAKGHVADAEGQGWMIDVVGRRRDVAAASPGLRTHRGIVCIGIEGQFDRAAIASVIAASSVTVTAKG